MTEKPIIFSAPMVRAILNGTKSQTRRIIKPQPPEDWCPSVGMYAPSLVCKRTGCLFPGAEVFGASDENFDSKSPWRPDDRLWVKETFWCWGRWRKNGITKTGRQKWRFVAHPNKDVCYQGEIVFQPKNRETVGFWTRPSIFMPRWASRITLRITNIRVERLQDISEADAKAEGCEAIAGNDAEYIPIDILKRLPNLETPTFTLGYALLWDSLNEKRGFGWDTNPWVWVVEFERVKQ